MKNYIDALAKAGEISGTNTSLVQIKQLDRNQYLKEHPELKTDVDGVHKVDQFADQQMKTRMQKIF